MTRAPSIFLYRYGAADLLKNYAAALTAAGLRPRIGGDLAAAGGCAGLLLCGGGDSDPALYGQENLFCRNVDLDRDLRELALVRRFAAAGRPILGICRGCQLLNFAFGGDLCQDLPTAARHRDRGAARRALSWRRSTGLRPGSPRPITRRWAVWPPASGRSSGRRTAWWRP